jgi:DNA polymerase-3 subunit alpha
MIPTKPLGVDLVTAIDMEPQLKDIVTNPSNPDNDDAAEIWEMALKLEGITRNTGKHAGGVVIAPGKITDYSAVLCEADGTSRVAQYDKDDVEAAGLVKFDFLVCVTSQLLKMPFKILIKESNLKFLSKLQMFH